jgi:hypothetical protein
MNMEINVSMMVNVKQVWLTRSQQITSDYQLGCEGMKGQSCSLARKWEGCSPLFGSRTTISICLNNPRTVQFYIWSRITDSEAVTTVPQ